MLGKEKIDDLMKPFLESTDVDEVEASYYGIEHALTRYANTITHQTMEVNDCSMTFRVIKNGSIGISGTNDISPDGLNLAFKNAIAIAERKKPTKNFPGLPSPSGEYEKIDTYCEASIQAGHEARIKGIKKVFDLAKKHDLSVAGRFKSGASEIMIANSKGIRAYQPFSFFDMSNIVMHPTFSAFSQAIGRDVTKADFDELAEKAVKKVLLGKNPKEIDVGKYDVILEPDAFGGLMEWLGYIGFTSRCMEEGTGFMYNKLGEKIVGENITLYDDAHDPRGMPTSFDFEGVPKKKVTFIENGVATGVVYDTYSGAKAGKESTGHSIGAKGMAYGAMPFNVVMNEGDKPFEDLVKSVERGVLVTRFHYINGFLHTPTARMTGMTRDGLFWVEDGEVKHGLKNMRWTDTMVRILNNVAMISDKTEAIPAWWGEGGAYIMPGVVVKDFEFTGKSDH